LIKSRANPSELGLLDTQHSVLNTDTVENDETAEIERTHTNEATQ